MAIPRCDDDAIVVNRESISKWLRTIQGAAQATSVDGAERSAPRSSV